MAMQPSVPPQDQNPQAAGKSKADEVSNVVNRRTLIGAGSAAVVGMLLSGEARGQSQPDTEKAEKDRSQSDIGPEDAPLDTVQPDTFMPPPTDHGETQTFWASFSAAHRRIQEGGWSRQVTVEDFPISTTIAGVNMRLTNGGVRELHWHNAGEWGIVLNGGVRLTAIDNDGKAFVDDVQKNGLWFFPSGNPHSIQGLPPDGGEFLLVFDDGKFSEANTTLISDWLRHTPPEVIAKNWSVSEKELEPIYQTPPNGRYIFQTPQPPSLEDDRKAASGERGHSPVAFTFDMEKMKPNFQNKSGEAKIVDSTNFKVSKTVAAAYVVVKPGGMRELHWHQNADEWQYYISGKARMTVFFNGSKARTADFNPGDVGYVPVTLGHYVENIGDTDMIYLEMFRTHKFEDLSLSEWVSHLPPAFLKDHIGISKADVLEKVPETKQVIVPA